MLYAGIKSQQSNRLLLKYKEIFYHFLLEIMVMD